MQKKVNYNEIYCLVKNYDSIFKNLKDVSDIFAERFTRGNMLVWDCPGEGWQSLDTADRATAQRVVFQLNAQKDAIKNEFSDEDAQTVEKIFQTPGDNCIFFKTDPNGNLKIKLTAWGYALPVRQKGNDTTGKIKPPIQPPQPPVEEEKQPEQPKTDEPEAEEFKIDEPETEQPTISVNPPVEEEPDKKVVQVISNPLQEEREENITIQEAPKQTEEKKVTSYASTTVIIKEENTTDFSWKHFLMSLGLIAMTVCTYYVCSQILM
ncbi:MAG: hypothetical protein K5685_12310 [Bacteroidales bacterium]|nr:hypothetical protein [Bacteroidales bacterium]